MKDLTPARSSLDPIELASRDEISALQLERLKNPCTTPMRMCLSTVKALMPQGSTPTI